MKRILGLDLGTNSIGWALVDSDFANKDGEIIGLGSRIIPMTQDVLDKFGSGQSISQTAERTGYRGIRRLYQRDNLRRERLHRVLHILGFLPEHYANNIDFEKKLGQFKNEVKLNYRLNHQGKYEFIFMNSFSEMVKDFKKAGFEEKIPYDWTIYYLRKKALKEKISKEELAWLILNFNQKRGYYQLRGEELEIDNKTFEILTVSKVEDSGEKISNSGETLYDIYFDNGWVYDKQTTKPQNWLGKSKEFIVTTKTLKDGTIKRTYKAVNSEEDWIAIKKKTEKDIDSSGKTVGEFIYENLLKNPTQKIRGKLIKTIERKFYKAELKSILATQMRFHEELSDEAIYEKAIEELYRRNEAHKSNIREKDFSHLFVDDIIFYQRPLKSKKSTIGGCQYEYKEFDQIDKETGEVKTERVWLKVIPKSHPLFIEFRLWQFLRNLKIYRKEEKENIDITSILIQTDSDWCDLFDFLNDKNDIEQKDIINYFIKKGQITKVEKDNYRWNYQEDKKQPINETRAQFISRLKKVNGFDLNQLTKEFEISLWHIIYSVNDKTEFQKALKTFAVKNNIDEDSFIAQFQKHPPYKSDYGSYSQKAIKKMLPFMRVGRYWNEEELDVVAKKRIETIIKRINSIGVENLDQMTEKELKQAIKSVSDDEIPVRFIKSFLKEKQNNPLAGLNTYQVGYAIYKRHSELSDISQWKTSIDIDTFLNNFKQHSLRNPIVEQLLTETLRTVRDIWNFYGEGQEKFFDEIHVELGREMKNSAEKRKRISNRNNENRKTNERIRELLKELKQQYQECDIRPHSPSHQEILKIYEEGIYENPNSKFNKVSQEDIVKIRRSNSPSNSEIQKYKLWLEQGYVSPYTGEIIPLGKLFTSAYQIEHIIPQSRFFDDSMQNKVICESAVNEKKDNQTAFAFLQSHGGEIIHLGNGKKVTLLKIGEYEIHCKEYFKKNRDKLKNLLSEDVPEGFIHRQMNDSRYISKLVKGLLSNIVREENEKEATVKRLLPTPGNVTSRLRHDWGLNDKWNELIAPRFKRLNELTNTNDYGYWDEKINAFRTTVPDELKTTFNKKRIDHRHHALDALVIACTTRNHTNYLHALNAEKENYSLRDSLLIKNKHGHYTKHFQLPWNNFPIDAKDALEATVISFKKNLRIINRTNNRYWKWVVQEDGSYKKQLVKQEGKNFAIRKPLHKETVSGKLNLKNIKVPKGKIVTATRISLSDLKTRKRLNSITDNSIQVILNNHLKHYTDEKGKENFDLAFSQDGIEELNRNIISLNNGKKHHPIYKVRLYEIGTKFPVSDTENNAKASKYVEAAKGTNLFFAIYWDEVKKKRNYETIPLNEVIAHQKSQIHLPKNERTLIPINREKGKLKFTLSPNDLVYVPSLDEIESANMFSVDSLSNLQANQIYKMVSSSGNQCFFIQSNVSQAIVNKVEFSALNKMEKDINGEMIKKVCWKLKVDRLGNIINIYQ